MSAGKIRDTYFRRAFVPIVLAVLVLAAIGVILYATPGAEAEMIGGAAGNLVNMVGGALRRTGQLIRSKQRIGHLPIGL